MKLEHSLIPYTNVNSKWVKDLKVTRNHKTSKGKQAEHSFDKNCTNISLDLSNMALEYGMKQGKG